MARNSGIFWAMFQCSQLFGNAFFYFIFLDKDMVNKDDRMLIVSVLFGCGAAGVISFLFLRPTTWAKREKVDGWEDAVSIAGDALKVSVGRTGSRKRNAPQSIGN